MNDSMNKSIEKNPPAQQVYIIYPQMLDESVNLLELVSALWQRRWLMVSIVILGVLAGIVYIALATPVYRAEVVLAPRQLEQGSVLSGGLGNLASLAGIGLGASGDVSEAIAALRSRALIEDFIGENDLLPVLFAEQWDAKGKRWISEDPEEWPDIRDAVSFFIEDVRTITDDPAANLIELTIEWHEAQTAAAWAEQLVYRVNERLRTQDLAAAERRLEYLNAELDRASLIEIRYAISRLIENQIENIMLAKAETEYAFKVIDPARIPNKPASPKPVLIVLVAVFSGVLVAVIVALVSFSMARAQARNQP